MNKTKGCLIANFATVPNSLTVMPSVRCFSVTGEYSTKSF
uniref:Uncharacterized protein n=1 Tax=Klebsiella pneumoniae TaxID=573 RepID=A0A4P8WDD4_KLEPN|nr:hypothetical protein [Klebsiella pneumoniae]